MFEALLAVHIVIAVALVVLVLLNQGKGADMGAAFGSGASSTVFGSRGAATFMTKLIATLGTTFFLTSLGLAVIASQGIGGGASVIGDDDVLESEEETEEEDPEAPAAPDMPAEQEAPAPEAPGQPVEPDAPAEEGEAE
ncbi:MAG: preprotein translocase subunit SecG [Halorhodospira halophila]|uniref:preprotein translocase subunit SecG n=1 Tax=Halorhodospira TaxID=85108 RepID=UPI0019130590|nr:MULTISPECIES: preprotein translocase subunit SecG [Halorhodospira]MBK5936224.1 preprotein translocase subunit SecG [Halorhodospira halophila]MBK5944083.1 preprotein translocase subunit SecG [Halorhodospira halophila]MCC3749883.1 preprotein translocase subunit SecG [Halorhodospira halophila]MCG5527803.1 preprotein translocase subunit SecG [Halorhodospira halophila]MCG5532795.1 preprotein translocase subunit SecG [Halorhodospira sp. 9621]